MSALIPIDDRFERLTDALEDPAERASFESLLPGYLRAQRWFGGASRTISTTIVTAWVDLGLEVDAALCVVHAGDGSGYETTHQLYLGILDDESGPPAVFDALEQPVVRQFLANLVLEGGTLAGHEVTLVGEPAADADLVRVPAESRVLDGEQTNTTLLYDEVCMAKVYRRLRSGTNPDVELLDALARAGFAAVPQYLGRATISAPGDVAGDAVLLERFVHNEGSGWDWALRHARVQLSAATTADELLAAMASDATLERAGALGSLTAEMHRTLDGLQGDGMASSPAEAASIEMLVQSLRDEAEETAVVAHRSAFTAAEIESALAAAASLATRSISNGGRLTRIHGDYHLGQLLAEVAGFTIIDFEGEPARTIAERRALQHPLVDVAGMLRSFDYAAQSALRESDAPSVLAPAWADGMRQAFLTGYWEAAADAAFLPPASDDREWLLVLLELRKALYELRYELEYRPAWAEIPANAIPSLVERL